MEKKVTINNTTLKIISLYLDDYLKRLHLRRISSALKINHRTITLHFDKLEKAGIFKSEYVGRHKEFYLNLDNILTRFYIAAAESYISLEFLNKNFLIKKLIPCVRGKDHPGRGVCECPALYAGRERFLREVYVTG